MIQLAPSIYASDYYEIKNQLNMLKDSGIKIIHFDIMDGNFVPALSFGPDFLERIRPHTDMEMDVHIMTTDPEQYILPCAKAGADRITIHVEAYEEKSLLLEAFEKIHKLGIKAGMVINPETKISQIPMKLFEKADVVQVMCVLPGRKNQTFRWEAVNKIEELNRIRDLKNTDFELEADGDIKPENISQIAKAGCNIMVVGKAIFSGDIKNNISRLEHSGNIKDKW